MLFFLTQQENLVDTLTKCVYLRTNESDFANVQDKTLARALFMMKSKLEKKNHPRYFHTCTQY